MTTSILIHPEELTKKWIDRAVRLGCDAIALHPRGGKEAADTLAELLTLFDVPEYRVLLDYAAARGLEIEYEFHALSYLLPRALFAEHPEYFRMDENGKRSPDCNLCFSNADALSIVKTRAAELAARLYRSTDRFYFWADDVHTGTCHCEKCRGLSPSDKNLLLMNAMIEGIRRKNPNARLACLAYRDTLAVPTAVKPAEGIFLEYAPIERDAHTPIEAQSDGRERELVRFFGDGAKVLDYWLDNSLFSKWKKPPARFSPDRAVIAADLEYYERIGFESVSSFACFLGDDYEALYGEPDIPKLKRE